METEQAVAGDSRPRPWLLIGLGFALLALLAQWMWPTASATPVVPASNQARANPRNTGAPIEAVDLDVRLEALNAPRPDSGSIERNPFRFQERAAPPMPQQAATRPGPAPPPEVPVVTGPPPPPPIPLKFIGIVEKQGLKVAAMSDCRMTYFGAEGEVIDGRYRLIRIGIESMVIEYVDGKGRTTVRLDGCPPR